MNCHLCGYEYDDSLGRYGCPNCHSEGLKRPVGRPRIQPDDRRVRLSVRIQPKTRQLIENWSFVHGCSMGEMIDKLTIREMPKH